MLLVLMWPALLLVLGLFQTWYYGYDGLVDWWYREINKSPDSGVWFYGSIEAARLRERLH